MFDSIGFVERKERGQTKCAHQAYNFYLLMYSRGRYSDLLIYKAFWREIRKNSKLKKDTYCYWPEKSFGYQSPVLA